MSPSNLGKAIRRYFTRELPAWALGTAVIGGICLAAGRPPKQSLMIGMFAGGATAIALVYAVNAGLYGI